MEIVQKLQVVGCGNMGAALPAGFAAAHPAAEVFALDSRMFSGAARLALAALGLGLTVFVKISIERTSSQVFTDFRVAVLSGIPGIRETHSYPVMEEIKDTPAIALGHLDKGAAR